MVLILVLELLEPESSPLGLALHEPVLVEKYLVPEKKAVPVTLEVVMERPTVFSKFHQPIIIS